MRRTAYIIGGGGHARVIASLLPHSTIRFVVEREPGPDDLLQAEVLSGAPLPNGDWYIGIGDNAVRRSLFDRLAALGAAPLRCVAESAWVARTAELGAGVFIAPGAIVMAGATVADNCLINTLSSLDHDSVMGEDSQATAGVILGAELKIGRNCYFGMRSCVISRIQVGDDAVVIGGALVADHVPAGAKVGGVPARRIASSPTRTGGPPPSRPTARIAP